jgi:hypothetical protein
MLDMEVSAYSFSALYVCVNPAAIAKSAASYHTSVIPQGIPPTLVTQKCQPRGYWAKRT